MITAAQVIHTMQSHKSREGGQLDDAYFDNLFIRLDIALACADLGIFSISLSLKRTFKASLSTL
jgi:hypothetical protein